MSFAVQPEPDEFQVASFSTRLADLLLPGFDRMLSTLQGRQKIQAGIEAADLGGRASISRLSQKHGSSLREGVCPRAKRATKKVLGLPIFFEMTDDEVLRVMRF